MRPLARKLLVLLPIAALAGTLATSANRSSSAAPPPALFNDAHFHLTSYVQKGPDARQFLAMVGNKVGRARRASTR